MPIASQNPILHAWSASHPLSPHYRATSCGQGLPSQGSCCLQVSPGCCCRPQNPLHGCPLLDLECELGQALSQACLPPKVPGLAEYWVGGRYAPGGRWEEALTRTRKGWVDVTWSSILGSPGSLFLLCWGWGRG